MFCNYYKETKDISEVEQIAFVRYYVDGVIYDRFLGFHIMDASSHFHYIGNIAAKSNTNIQKCIQKSYDDANVMTNETAPKEMT
jgi:hypothetical protein